MARHFARLKLRLIRNGLRISTAQAVGLVVGAVVALPLALGGFLALATVPRAAPEAGLPLAVLGFSFLFLAWLLAPLLAFGTDETLDPARLTLLPLTRRRLMTGLLTASMVGVAPVATLLALTGGIVGYLPLGPGAVVVVAAVVVEMLLCLTGSRAFVTALSGLLRSRRARDMTVMLTVLVMLLFNLGIQALSALASAADTGSIERLAQVLSWLPPGLAGRSMADAAAGRLLPAVAELAVAAAAVLLLARGWAAALERVSTGTEHTAAGRGSSRLFAGPLGALPRSRIGAVAAKELRYAWRDPRRRATLLSTVPMALLPTALLLSDGSRSELFVLGAVLVALVAGATSLNQLGMDGPAYWAHVATGEDVAADLRGKGLATMVLGVPLLALVAVALAAMTGGWLLAPVAVGFGAGLLLTQLGVGCVVSVLNPVPMVESTNPWAVGGTGQGCAAGLVHLAGLLALQLLVLPVAVVAVATAVMWRPALAVTSAVAVGYGYLLWRVGIHMAARRAEGRIPELLEALSPRRAG